MTFVQLHVSIENINIFFAISGLFNFISQVSVVTFWCKRWIVNFKARTLILGHWRRPSRSHGSRKRNAGPDLAHGPPDWHMCVKRLAVTCASLRNMQAKATRSRTATLFSYWNTNKESYLLQMFCSDKFAKRFGFSCAFSHSTCKLWGCLFQDTVQKAYVAPSEFSESRWMEKSKTLPALFGRKTSGGDK